MKLQSMSVRLILTTISLFIFSAVFSQTLRLTGKVLNERNEPVAGASIKIAGSTTGTSTNVEGVYNLNLNAGTKYTLEVSAVGYTPKTISDVDVTAGGVNEFNIVLETATKTQETIIVRATSRRQESTASLITFQRNSTSLSSGLAADFIRRTPDRNTGEVLKRVSGASIQDNKFVVVRGLSDRYNQAMINNAQLPSSEPDKKVFSFDLIPSQMVDNVIINKTATPDLPGEFAGGLVQIRTKDVPTQNVLSAGVSIGYNSQSTFKDFTSNKRNGMDWLGFDNGTRNLPSSIPSTEQYRALTDAEKIRLTKDFPGDVYSEKTVKAAPITTFHLTWTNSSRSKKNNGVFGTIVSLYHRKGMNIYDDVERGRYDFVRTPIFNGTETQNRYNVTAGGLVNLSYVRGGHKISFKNLFNQSFEDIYYSRSLVNTGRLQNIQLRSSFLNQRSLYSGQLEGEHAITRSGIRLTWNGNFAYNFKKQPDLRTAQYVQALSDPTSEYEMDDDDTRRFYSSLQDYSVGGNGSLVIPFTMGGSKQTFKVGGSGLLRFRDFNARVFRYRPASTSANTKKAFDLAFLPGNINANGLYLDEQTQNTDKYFAISALNAGYAMFDNTISKNWRIIWGARAEFFEQFLQSKDLSLKRIVVNTEKWDILPSLNVTYNFKTNHQLRLAASKTVARPEFREIAPFQFFDYEQIWGINGETDLKRTSILNGDLRYEFYPRSGEVISLGAFVKKFDDPIELRMDVGSNSDRWLFNYANADKATLTGAEVEFRKGLGFFGDAFKNFTFVGNATILDSKVTLTTTQASGKDTEQDRPLYGQSPYLFNAGFQYTTPTWNASALYNKIGPRLYLVGDPNGTGFYDIYEKSRNLVDLQVSRKLFNGKGELKMTVSDLLNNRFAFYDNPSKNASYNFNEGDRINYGYRPGTTITVGFTYDFSLKSK
jgi:hypothetical protein